VVETITAPQPLVGAQFTSRWRDGCLFLQIAAVACAAPWVARLPLQRLERVLEPRHPVLRPSFHTRIPLLVDRAIRWGSPIIRRGCLTRGITSYYFLRRSGLDVQLVFGVGRVGGAMEGHCWLLVDGEPFAERQDPRLTFTRVAAIGPRNGAIGSRHG
jgi:hypothetical protein